MIKKICIALALICISAPTVSALNAGSVSAECAVLLSAQTGEVLFDKNANQQHSMASTTKIMTALLSIESGLTQNEIKVTDSMLNVEGTSMGLLPGDSVSLGELVYGMMLPSGNDAANVAALYLGGSMEGFAEMMNVRAAQIGMKNTHFVTPSGLDSEDHYSTAYDMALLGREAVKNPLFLSVCSSKKKTLTYGNPPYSRTLYNHNRLLEYYDYALGIKTGFTKKSGRCLVSYAEKDGVGFIAVTLNAPNDWNDHKVMLNYGFETLKVKQIKPEVPTSVTVVGADVEQIRISVNNLVLQTADNPATEQRIYMKKFLYAPVKAGDIIGRCELYADGELIDSQNIIAAESAEVKQADTYDSERSEPEKSNIFKKIKEKLGSFFTAFRRDSIG